MVVLVGDLKKNINWDFIRIKRLDGAECVICVQECFLKHVSMALLEKGPSS